MSDRKCIFLINKKHEKEIICLKTKTYSTVVKAGILYSHTIYERKNTLCVRYCRYYTQGKN